MFHIHHDFNWQQSGVYALHICKCGKRKIRRIYFGGHSSIPNEWRKLLINKHGQIVNDSGWKNG